uniref:Uncharacterized protein n=1 Tax=Rhizophora mucronata TaxID=61149 RepID=A0A2P2P5D0_RHIMU
MQVHNFKNIVNQGGEKIMFMPKFQNEILLHGSS